MPAIKNPDIPHSDVPYVYFRSPSNDWRLQTSVHFVHYDEGPFSTEKEAKAAQPDFVRRVLCRPGCGRCDKRRLALLGAVAV